jgi:predicted nucleotidyltransferase
VKVQREQRDTADPVAYYTAQPGAVAAVAQREGMELIVLFDSAAQGRLRSESDLDIAVRFANGWPGFEAEARVAAELHAALNAPRELDLVPLHHASPILLIQVAAQGGPLFEASDEVWPHFQLYARRRFEDTEKYRRRRWATLLERLAGRHLVDRSPTARGQASITLMEDRRSGRLQDTALPPTQRTKLQ